MKSNNASTTRPPSSSQHQRPRWSRRNVVKQIITPDGREILRITRKAPPEVFRFSGEKSHFTAAEPGGPGGPSLQTCLIAILLLTCAADGEIEDSELDVVRQVVSEQLGVPPGEIHHSMRLASDVLCCLMQEGNIRLLTDTIGRCLGPEEKEGLYASLWQVILADNSIHMGELIHVNEMAKTLDIPWEQQDSILTAIASVA